MHKMSCDQFVSNNRGIGLDGADLPRELLAALYSSIVSNEIRLEQACEWGSLRRNNMHPSFRYTHRLLTPCAHTFRSAGAARVHLSGQGRLAPQAGRPRQDDAPPVDHPLRLDPVLLCGTKGGDAARVRPAGERQRRAGSNLHPHCPHLFTPLLTPLFTPLRSASSRCRTRTHS